MTEKKLPLEGSTVDHLKDNCAQDGAKAPHEGRRHGLRSVLNVLCAVIRRVRQCYDKHDRYRNAQDGEHDTDAGERHARHLVSNVKVGIFLAVDVALEEINAAAHAHDALPIDQKYMIPI